MVKSENEVVEKKQRQNLPAVYKKRLVGRFLRNIFIIYITHIAKHTGINSERNPFIESNRFKVVGAAETLPTHDEWHFVAECCHRQ